MSNQSNEFRSSRPWARTGFDIEGWVGALAALLFGIFAGTFWYPFFILGVLAAGIVLAATRRVTRTSPAGEFHVLAPCDGVVSSVARALPPPEFGFAGDELVRVRISSSPFSPNNLFAPITGTVSEVAFDEGDPSRVLASDPEAGGLEVSYLAIGAGTEAVGLKIMTAGFGPRLDVETEVGDMLRAGRSFAKRRLGGWCDVYLPVGLEAAVWPGQTLIGGETDLGAVSDNWVVRSAREDEIETSPEPEAVETEPEIDLEELGTSHAESETSTETSAEPEAPEDRAAKAFEKLRREAQGVEDKD